MTSMAPTPMKLSALVSTRVNIPAIDLNSGHASELRDFLSRFQDAARKEGGTTKRQGKSTSGVDTKAVRLWAADNGIQVNTRARSQADVVEKYLAAH